MLPRELVEGWARLREHPEIFAAVVAGSGGIDEAVAQRSVLDALVAPPSLEDAAERLLRLGMWTAALELVEDADSTLQQHVHGAHARWTSDLEVQLVALATRARAAGAELADEAPAHDLGLDRRSTDLGLAEATAAVEALEDACLRALGAQLQAVGLEERWDLQPMLAVRAAIRGRDPAVARRLLDGAARRLGWPQVRDAELVIPATAIARRSAWPWRLPLGECLDWFDADGYASAGAPAGFAERWAPDPEDDVAGEVLGLLRDVARATDPVSAMHPLVEAVARVLDARVTSAATLVLDDERLGVLPALLGPLRARPNTRPGLRGGIYIDVDDGASEQRLSIAVADVLGVLGERVNRRALLLRRLSSGLSLATPLDAPAAWADDTEDMLGWTADLLGLELQTQILPTLCELAADQHDVAIRLLAALTSPGVGGVRRARPVVLADLQRAWRSDAFRDGTRAALRDSAPAAEITLRTLAWLDTDTIEMTDVYEASKMFDEAVAEAAVADACAALTRTGRITVDDVVTVSERLRALTRHVIGDD